MWPECRSGIGACIFVRRQHLDRAADRLRLLPRADSLSCVTCIFDTSMARLGLDRTQLALLSEC